MAASAGAIQALDWIVNTIETFRSSLILYVDGYREIEPDSRGEISQDVLEEQLERLQQGKYEFCETTERIEQILREVNQYMPIEGIAAAPVEECFDNAFRYAEETRSRVGEYEEAHSNDLDSVEEMLHHIDGFLKRHVNARIADITSYQPGTFARTPEYEKAQQLSEMHRSFVTMVSDRVREGLANRDQRPAPVIIDATGENDIAVGNPVRLKYVAARGAFFKETVTGVPKLQGAGAAKIQEIAGQIRGGEIPQYVNRRALRNLGKRIVEEGQRIQEKLAEPAKIVDWLNLYQFPTVWGGGRSVPRHENAKVYDWGMEEELMGVSGLEQGMLTHNSAGVIEADGKIPVVNITRNHLYTDQEGRYWVAVGPNIMNPEHQPDERITVEEMQYGTKIDIVVVEEDTGDKYYIPAVVGDVKGHTAPNGLYQTGEAFADGIDDLNCNDGSTIEFMGWDIEKHSVNVTNNFRLEKIIVYEGMTNYQ